MYDPQVVASFFLQVSAWYTDSKQHHFLLTQHAKRAIASVSIVVLLCASRRPVAQGLLLSFVVECISVR